jgi:hypothetical protein
MKKELFSWGVALAMLVPIGCRDEEGPGAAEASDTSGDPTPDTTSSSTDTEPSTSDSTTLPPDDDDGDSFGKLDVFAIPDAPDSDIEGCKAVDFLFVIDNSGSMSDEQDNLTESFPGFFSAIAASLEQVSTYHVGVVTTDDYTFNVPECSSIGGLVVRTGGQSSFSADCGPYAAGENYMTVADHLPSKFKCAGKVGVSGSGEERPLLAMSNAISGELTEDGECNDGFIRDQALLVVVLITDEQDQSPDSAGEYFGTIVETKGGHPENVAVVALTPDHSDELVKFTQLFGMNAFRGDIAADDYGPLLVQAIDTISYACENFIPEG